MKKHRSKKPQKERTNNALIPVEDLEDKSESLRKKHDKITDRQHELVVTILHDDCTITEASKRIGANRSWATTTLNKQHVIQYMRELAMNTIGAHSLRAIATMSNLLDSKSDYIRLEASRDLMDRAGLKQDDGSSGSPQLHINISI